MQRTVNLNPSQRLTSMMVMSRAIFETNYHLSLTKTCDRILTLRGYITRGMAIKRRRRCLQLFRQANRGFVC